MDQPKPCRACPGRGSTRKSAQRAQFLSSLIAFGCSSGDEGQPLAREAPLAPGQHTDPSYAPALAIETAGAQALAAYRAFSALAADLELASADYASSLSGQDHDRVRAVWKSAMDAWQHAELYRFGPAGDASTPFGAGIGDEIYSWVVSTNPCRVDQETTAADHADPVAAAAKPINVRGLDALEYLLFVPDSSNQCSAGLSINADGTWAGIAGELPQRRASQAHALAVDLHERARVLVAAWEPAGGDFAARLSEGRAYGDTAEAFGAVVGATLYLDTQTKDRKVGIPSGLIDCVGETCPGALESRFAGVSRQNVRANLAAFRDLLSGSVPDGEAGFGIADQLEHLGAVELAREMEGDVDAAIGAVDALGELSFGEALDRDLESLREVYGAIKAVTDRIKRELVEELDLTLTQPGAGDAD